MLKRTIGAVVFSAILLSLPALAQKRRFGQPPPTPLPPACGNQAEKFAVKDSFDGGPAQPPPGKALVYFIQGSLNPPAIGHAPQTRFGVDGNWAGAAHEYSYFSFVVDPGVHHLCAATGQSPDFLGPLVRLAHFTAEAGGIYFFESEIVGGGYGIDATLLPIDSDQGSYWAASNQPVKSYPKK